MIGLSWKGILMIGVNIDNIDALIKKNNLYFNSLDSNLKTLQSIINDLDNCYSGNNLSYLFSEPINSIKDIQTIPTIIKSYSDVLTQVKLSYQAQDENIKAQINHLNSNL